MTNKKNKRLQEFHYREIILRLFPSTSSSERFSRLCIEVERFPQRQRKDHVPRLWVFRYRLILLILKYVVEEGLRNRNSHGAEVRSVIGQE